MILQFSFSLGHFTSYAPDAGVYEGNQLVGCQESSFSPVNHLPLSVVEAWYDHYYFRQGNPQPVGVLDRTNVEANISGDFPQPAMVLRQGQGYSEPDPYFDHHTVSPPTAAFVLNRAEIYSYCKVGIGSTGATKWFYVGRYKHDTPAGNVGGTSSYPEGCLYGKGYAGYTNQFTSYNGEGGFGGSYNRYQESGVPTPAGQNGPELISGDGQQYRWRPPHPVPSYTESLFFPEAILSYTLSCGNWSQTLTFTAAERAQFSPNKEILFRADELPVGVLRIHTAFDDATNEAEFYFAPVAKITGSISSANIVSLNNNGSFALGMAIVDPNLKWHWKVPSETGFETIDGGPQLTWDANPILEKIADGLQATNSNFVYNPNTETATLYFRLHLERRDYPAILIDDSKPTEGIASVNFAVPVSTARVGLLADRLGWVLTATKSGTGTVIKRYDGTAETALTTLAGLSQARLAASLEAHYYLLALNKSANQWQFFQSHDTGENWSFMSIPFDAGTYKSVDICQTSDGPLLAAGVHRTTTATAIKISYDRGAVWETVVTTTAGTGAKALSLKSAWVGESRVYLCADNALKYSTDLGSTWANA